MLLPKDYVRLRLTGELRRWTRRTAPGTLLFDLAARDWSAEVLGALGIDPAWLPPTFEGPEVTGDDHAPRRPPPPACGPARRSSPAAATSRPTRSASGAVSPARSRSRWARRASSSRPPIGPLHEPDGRVHAFCHAVPGRWHLMSVMLSAAGSLRWFRDALAPGDGVRRPLVEAAADVPAGSDGLLFLPYLTGERSPHPDPARARRVRRPDRSATTGGT